MVNVTFYLLDQQYSSQEHFACRLVEKVHRQGLSIHLHCSDEAHARQMDALLWSWKEESFLPHHIINGAEQPAKAAITLGWTSGLTKHVDCLINLAAGVPEDFTAFKRVCEIVVDAEDQKIISRDKFRGYKQAQVTPQIHRMSRG